MRTYVCAMRYAFKLAAGDGLLPTNADPAGALSLQGTAPDTRHPLAEAPQPVRRRGR
ncbi:hypothetical protein [Nitriliruptor alkaliphilus]|uniref:hypothetical protein n=1 Tax=Nitriliruptor alkaliphilus TaxID=427918 RepID=UPI00147024C8|nr:hypothetical protein [Nitriliruptor alkaliphilus]